jgi:outer membrane protein OmpA-like peptidoglycan-associated protein
VLGGQHKEYLIKQLTDFKHEVRENDRSGMMLRITTHLTAHDIEAVATYLSRVPAPAPAPAHVSVPDPAPVPESWKILLEAKPVTIEGVNFVAGSVNLKSKNVKTLDEAVGFVGQHPDAKLELIGYSDTSGFAMQNQKLS